MLEIKKIKKGVKNLKETGLTGWNLASAVYDAYLKDVPALIAEVEQLRKFYNEWVDREDHYQEVSAQLDCARGRIDELKAQLAEFRSREQEAEDAIKKSCENCSFNTCPCDSTDCAFYKFKELLGARIDAEAKTTERKEAIPTNPQAEKIKMENEKKWKEYTDDALRTSWAEAIPLERLIEIVDADLQGRLIVLPNNGFIAKAGDTLYLLDEGDIIEVTHCGAEIGPDGKISAVVIADDKIFPWREPDAEHDLSPTDWCTDKKTITPDDIGKTVFYTREHAERAQKGDV